MFYSNLQATKWHLLAAWYWSQTSPELAGCDSTAADSRPGRQDTGKDCTMGRTWNAKNCGPWTLAVRQNSNIFNLKTLVILECLEWLLDVQIETYQVHRRFEIKSSETGQTLPGRPSRCTWYPVTKCQPSHCRPWEDHVFVKGVTRVAV